MSRTPFDASREAMGLLETTGLTPAIVAVDQMEKAAPIRVLECELNDYYGVVVKIAGRVDAVLSALEAAHTIAAAMGGEPVISILSRPEPRAAAAIRSPRQFNPLIEQDTVFVPETDDKRQLLQRKDQPAMVETSTALGFIETQGFTAVFDAIDTACKAANVEIVGKEKLGGG
ncbi:MAG: BMC domain-containing protein, partial [Planctomycetota bacterium]